MGLAAAAGTAHAAIRIVNTTDDHLDGVCSDDCSLRDAIFVSNLNADFDFISVPPGTFNLSVTGLDQDGVADIGLSQLGDFGGPTLTVMPLPGSPVVGGGADALCLTYDQRGLLRNVGLCDAGAVERQDGDPNPIFLDGFESGNDSAWSATAP